MVELERRGIPTVLFTSKTFVHDAERSAATFGLPGLPIAVVPLPFTNQRPEAVHAMAEEALEQVLAGLTRPVEQPTARERAAADERLAYDGEDLLGALAAMNADFIKRGWSDGFPLVAPTERAVTAMLAGTKRPPDEVVCTLEPGFGLATVRALAVNAVMAGCLPASTRGRRRWRPRTRSWVGWPITLTCRCQSWRIPPASTSRWWAERRGVGHTSMGPGSP